MTFTFVRFTTVAGRICHVNPAAVALVEEATLSGKVMPDQTRLYLLALGRADTDDGLLVVVRGTVQEVIDALHGGMIA